MNLPLYATPCGSQRGQWFCYSCWIGLLTDNAASRHESADHFVLWRCYDHQVLEPRSR